jgi:hypothetical protein
MSDQRKNEKPTHIGDDIMDALKSTEPPLHERICILVGGELSESWKRQGWVFQWACHEFGDELSYHVSIAESSVSERERIIKGVSEFRSIGAYLRYRIGQISESKGMVVPRNDEAKYLMER